MSVDQWSQLPAVDPVRVCGRVTGDPVAGEIGGVRSPSQHSRPLRRAYEELVHAVAVDVGHSEPILRAEVPATDPRPGTCTKAQPSLDVDPGREAEAVVAFERVKAAVVRSSRVWKIAC
jgi:hypothetical protein